MRYLLLDSTTDESYLNFALDRMSSKDFLLSVKSFLSVLAVAEAEDLVYLRSMLSPHELSFNYGPPASHACEIPQDTPNLFQSSSHDSGIALQRDAPASPALRLTTPDTADRYDPFAPYTTPEDHSSPYEWASDFDTEMPYCGENTTVRSITQSSTPRTFENTSNTPTAAHQIDIANQTMRVVAETINYHPTTTDALYDKDPFDLYTKANDYVPHNVVGDTANVENAYSISNEGMQDYAITLTPTHVIPRTHATMHENSTTRAISGENVMDSEIGTASEVAPRSTTSDTADESDIFAIYTTLEDHASPNERAASANTEMLDCSEDTTVAPTASTSIIQSSTPLTFENTSNTPTPDDPSDPANNSMSDIGGTPLSQVARHTEYSSESPSQASSNWSMSPVLDSRYPWSASSPPPTRYLRDFKRLDSLYGGSSARGLKNINDIINLGDHFLREDIVNHIETFRQGWGREGLWNRAPLSNPSTGSSVVEKMLKSLRCAENIEYDSAVDPVRLRIARIFLYHYFEQKCINIKKDPNLPGLLPQGKRISSVALDVILEEMHGRHDQKVGLRVSKQRRKSLKDHKTLGKRWSILAHDLGIGIIVTCSRSLETHMNNTKFTERMILALLTYILNVYPQGVQVSQMVDPFVQCMMEGALSPVWPAAETFAVINGYEQQKEQDCYTEKDEWQPVAPPKSFVPLILM